MLKVNAFKQEHTPVMSSWNVSIHQILMGYLVSIQIRDIPTPISPLCNIAVIHYEYAFQL